ncbi:potassium channel family protein [Sabulicella rubraurantiaca]|uniref:potassium channel family protein n=1 Tax=Sabulicella rubraurantiaca TaxID=2811429 RepID=UPI001A960FFB|nr:potassium channel family protein [Sabulicella rubraurantiaca]
MTLHDVAQVRRAFLRALVQELGVLWPILSALLAVIAGLGATVGAIEGWGFGQGLYFAAVTSLTIGYGDLTPSLPLTKLLAAAIGLLGIAAAGLVAALAVRAYEATAGGKRVTHGTEGDGATARSRADGSEA